MRPTIVRRFARLAPLAVVTALAASAPSSAQAAECSGLDSTPQQLGAAATQATTLCALNAERTAEGVRPLRSGSTLARVAMRHSRDMIANVYFAHDSQSGAAFSTRISRSGYLREREDWAIGENLAWGRAASSTPRSIVAAWMASPLHRKNILQRRFRVVGIGVAGGMPVAIAGQGSTYTTDFGS